VKYRMEEDAMKALAKKKKWVCCSLEFVIEKSYLRIFNPHEFNLKSGMNGFKNPKDIGSEL
jgi:hypothetical protein